MLDLIAFHFAFLLWVSLQKEFCDNNIFNIIKTTNIFGSIHSLLWECHRNVFNIFMWRFFGPTHMLLSLVNTFCYHNVFSFLLSSSSSSW